MEIRVVQGDIAQLESDCIVVNLFEGVSAPSGATGAVDQALGGAISRLIASGDFTGKAESAALLYTDGKIPSPRLLVVGLGKAEKFDLHGVRRASAVASKTLAKTGGVKNYATIVPGAGIAGLDVSQASQSMAEGALMALYQATQYKREQKPAGLDSCAVVEFSQEKLAEVTAGVARGEVIARSVHTARDLVSEPPNLLFPMELASRARKMAEKVGLKSTVLGEAAMREMGMNILLAVSKGSGHEAQFLILEHAPAGHEEEQPLIFAGKGITFDTGGISLKPEAEMWRMKNDMGGAAAVIGALEAIGRLNLPRRVIGVAACVENMPDGLAFRPADIVTGMTGKTAEIISTDAEGRLVLADALAYVARFNPSAVVDLATLTGAVGVALGTVRGGLFANNEDLQAALMAAGERSGDKLWPFPMDKEYVEGIKSDMAEVKNSGGKGSGLSSSAKFLEHFTEGYPWAHLDIANMVWSDTEKGAENPKGATGYGVRLLVELASAI